MPLTFRAQWLYFRMEFRFQWGQYRQATRAQWRALVNSH